MVRIRQRDLTDEEYQSALSMAKRIANIHFKNIPFWARSQVGFDDLVQAAIVAAWKTAVKFDCPVRNLGMYSERSMRCAVIDLLRSLTSSRHPSQFERRQRVQGIHYGVSSDLDKALGRIDTRFSEVDDSDCPIESLDAWKVLTRDERDIIYSRMLGMTSAEMAREEGLPHATMDSRMKRAMGVFANAITVRDCMRLGFEKLPPREPRPPVQTGPKTCKHGHPQTLENVYLLRDGNVTCKLCRQMQNRKSRAKIKAMKTANAGA